MRPWSSPAAASTLADVATLPTNTNEVTAGGAPTTSVHASAAMQNLPLASPAAAHDLTSVLDKLQQVREIDPAAEQKLLEELRKASPNSWPLVAEQFRASLAYREELLAADGQSHDAKQQPSIDLAASTSIQSKRSPADPVIAANTAPTTVKTRTIPQPQNPPATSPAVDTSVQQVSLNAISDTSAAKPVEPPTEDETETPLAKPDTEWQQLVQQAADDLSRRAAASPTTTAEVHQHVSLRILRLLAGDTEGALEPIPQISPAEQDYWSKQLFALATYLDHHRQPDEKRRAAASVIHLDEAISHLRELGALSVRNLSFCKNVYGYGAIEPYDADRFSPGEHVSLYVEVENYHSKSTEKGYCTSLGSTYEILNEAGQRVGGGEIPDVNDCCRSRRRDFHIHYALSLPQSLVPGRYQLQLLIKDRQSDKRGQATVGFEIKGTPTPVQANN